MKFKHKLLLLLSFFIFGCTEKKEETPAPTKTGVELIAVGSIQFGNVIIGEHREAVIRVTNHGPDKIENFNPSLIAPFSISKIAPPCNTGTIPVGISCNVTVRFTPAAKGLYNDTFTLVDKSQAISGQGLDSAGILDYSTTSWDLGSVVSGETTLRDVSLTNNGDFTVTTPTYDPLTGYNRTLNECGTFIAPRRTCLMRFSIVKQGVGSYTETLTFHSADTSTTNLTVTSTVVPGPPSGSIVYLNPPSAIIADNADVRTITTAPIRDQFNNVVSDGNSVSIIVSNLTIVGANTRTTVGGVITFDVKATNQRGDATITVISGASSGFVRFRSLSGPPVGDIVSKPYINSVEANGISQIDIRFNPLRDQFNNTVEDGTPVHFCVRTQANECFSNDGLFSPRPGNNAGGTLVAPISTTVLGESQATIIPPTQTGSATLVVQAGVQNGAAPCGWSACGFFNLSYLPGQSSGTINVVSSLEGIYADPSSGITASPPEIIQSTINIGPVRDRFNNIVATGTLITIDLVNAIGVSDGLSHFTVATNGSGTANFAIQGTGARGYITIAASKDLASGSHKIWAYGDAVLRPLGSSYPNNPFKVYMTYNSISTDPNVASGWGLIKNWANIDVQDHNYFGDLKKQAPPTLIYNTLPYLVNKCFFSSGNTSYGAGCFINNFNDANLSQNTFKVVKANTTGDPGASRVDVILNAYPRNAHHKETPVGCYKIDNTEGSATIGNLLFYSYAPIERCNSFTSEDEESPVYRNDQYDFFGGTWLTNNSYNLNYPATGFLPDLGRVLTFGGFYELPKPGGFQSPNNFEVVLSDRHLWGGNFGIDLPYVLTKKMNDDADGLYGDFPEKVTMPTMTNSNKDLYMFGGLELRGVSHTDAGPTISYVQSTASDNFSVFDSILNKWFSLSPGDDDTIPGQNTKKNPVGRYQHGMVFVPDNNKVFIAGGKSVNLQTSLNWFDANDMWSVDMTDRGANLQWRRNCSPCGFPVGANYHPSALKPSTLNPTPVKMTYNPYLQKVFMLWSGTSSNIYNFNPLGASPVLSVNSSNPYSFSSLQSPELFDMEVNQDIGRTYFYKRKSTTLNNSEVYYWDMDAGNKQFVRIETDLGGAPAKTFIRRLSVHVRGFGNILNESQAVQGIGGITVKIFNYNTNLWEVVGFNTAKLESEDVLAQAISNTYGPGAASKYVSPEGKVNVFITIRDLSSYIGSGYNELKVDEFYIDGLF